MQKWVLNSKGNTRFAFSIHWKK